MESDDPLRLRFGAFNKYFGIFCRIEPSQNHQEVGLADGHAPGCGLIAAVQEDGGSPAGDDRVRIVFYDDAVGVRVRVIAQALCAVPRSAR